MRSTLLVADDSITIQRVIELTFADQDVRVVPVGDGQEAIERMNGFRPDIILADIAMPRVDGYDVARYVRSQPELRGVPVLLLAGAFEPVDETRLRDCGAAGVLVKPFEPNAVISRVKELLGLGTPAPGPSPGSRLVTGYTAPPRKSPMVAPAPPAAAAAAPPEPAPSPGPPASGQPGTWDELRKESGLGPDTAAVEHIGRNPEDYLASLDDAFDSLDEQLAGRGITQGKRTPGKPAPRMPTALDPVARARMRAAGATASDVAPVGSVERPPVFEVDHDWFDTAPEVVLLSETGTPDGDEEGDNRAPAVAPPAEAESGPAAPRTPPVAAPVPRVAATPAAAPAAPLTPHAFADAFEALLAVEQGEILPEEMAAPVQEPPARSMTFEVTDDMVDRIAARVAERLTGGAFRAAVTEAVADVVGAVSERLVREEIERIRNSRD